MKRRLDSRTELRLVSPAGPQLNRLEPFDLVTVHFKPQHCPQRMKSLVACRAWIEVDDSVYALETQPHKGSPSNPFTWDEICEKFRRYTREIISADQAEAIIDGVAHLEQSSDIANLARLFAVG